MSRLGIIAGADALPGLLVARCREQPIDHVVFAIRGQGNEQLALPENRLPIGGLAALRRRVRRLGITDLVIIGALKKPSLWQLRPDWLLLSQLPRLMIWRRGDDGVLRRAVRMAERVLHVTVRGVHEFLPELLATAGAWGRVQPDATALTLIKQGVAAATAHGAADLGQAVIVGPQGVAAYEGRAGTSAMLAAFRVVNLPAVLVKLAKPQQDLRVDLPTVGPRTVTLARDAGLAGIAVQADKTLTVDRAGMIAAADAAGLFLYGVDVA